MVGRQAKRTVDRPCPYCAQPQSGKRALWEHRIVCAKNPREIKRKRILAEQKEQPETVSR